MENIGYQDAQTCRLSADMPCNSLDTADANGYAWLSLKKGAFSMRNTLISVFGCSVVLSTAATAQESLFTPELASTPLARDVFAYIDENRDNIIEEWIQLTEIPAPSGHEERRAQYFVEQFEAAGLEEVSVDEVGNVVGIWRGSGQGEKIV
ncbi:hypothetical protein ACFL3B_06265, partial [Gemmatimonadota bacterium]